MSELAYSDNKIEAFQVLMMSETVPLQQLVNFTNTSKYSANLNEATTAIELLASQDCYIRLVRSTSSDVAVAEASEQNKAVSVFIAGGISKFFGIPKIEGVIWKLAVVRKDTSGTLYITEGA